MIPDVVSATDYGCFGNPLPGRSFNSNRYKYGFNGKENDKETVGTGEGTQDYGARIYNPALGRWLSTDPLANKYPDLSPYNSFGNNPIVNIDPDGRKILKFDKDGNYVGKSHDNWFHNTFFGTKGRMYDANGDVSRKFTFADPKNDSKDIENGVIRKIVVVDQNDILKMMTASGANDPHNNISDKSPLDGRFDYILAEGVGGGKLDFSFTQIPSMYPEASNSPQFSPSPIMFLVDDMAHNHMNFGNFLFGQAGQNMGFMLQELLLGAHYNSLVNPDKNNYKSQFDSPDDQKSIEKGYENGMFNNKNYSVEVGDLEYGGVIDDKGTPTPIKP